jgi:Protein of unknown function (DUF3592)
MAQRNTGTKLYLTFIGLLLALAGGLFTALMWRSFERAVDEKHWPEVPCVVLRSEVEVRQVDPNSPEEKRFSVLYGYLWEGKSYESDRLKLRSNPWSGDIDRITPYLRKYPVGAKVTCRVSPQDPKEAVLELESRAPGYSIWFPLLFVVGGIGIIIGAWREKKTVKLPA